MGNLRLFERYKSLATDAGIQIQKRAIVDIFKLMRVCKG